MCAVLQWPNPRCRSHSFQSPYRCQSCESRFWVLSRKTRIGTTAAGACALFILVMATGSMTRYRAGELWAYVKTDIVGAPDEQNAGASVVVKDERLSVDGSHVDARAGQGKLPRVAQDLEQ